MENTSAIEKAVEQMLSLEGMELADLRMGRHGAKALFQFFIDRKDGSITLEDCERMSDKIGAVLDMENLVGGAYVLEVSSPGVDRVLKKPEHFTRFTGKKAKLQLKAPFEGSAVYTGVIKGFENNSVIIDHGGRVLTFGLDMLKQARIDPELDI